MELSAIVVVPGIEEAAAVCGFVPKVLEALEILWPLCSSRMADTWQRCPAFVDGSRPQARSAKLVAYFRCPRRKHGLVLSWPSWPGRGSNGFCVIKLKSYAEMDLADLLRFHCEKRNPVTEAHDSRGQLGVCLLDRRALRSTGEKHDHVPLALPTSVRGFPINSADMPSAFCPREKGRSWLGMH